MRPPPPVPSTLKAPRVFTVSEMARRIKSLLETQFASVCIEGEISGFTQPASGHQYFNLKDPQALIKAAWFKGSQRGVPLQLQDGMQVKVYGDISAYSQRSEYQVIVHRVEPAGTGTLQQAYEALKKRLTEEGLFAPEHKQPLPYLPRHIGIITSPSGAVIRDMITVLTRRFPYLQITLAGVPVQGVQAAAAIEKALSFFNEQYPVDVILLGRGGGSLEDLWAFNEEPVVRAVHRSRIPVISAVGHEPDFSLCDFVADVRAPTPSAAAEIAVPEYEKLVKHLHSQHRHLVHALEHYRHVLISRFVKASGSYVFREPGHAVKRHRQNLAYQKMQLINQTQSVLTQRRNRLEHHAQGVKHHAQRRVQQGQQQVDQLHLRMMHTASGMLQSQRARLHQLASQLRALSHQAVLERGYSITRTSDGQVVRDAGHLKTGAGLRTELASGHVYSIVESIEKNEVKS